MTAPTLPPKSGRLLKRSGVEMRLGLLITASRLLAKPLLARTATPQQARSDFARMAGFLSSPPYVLHLPGAGVLPLHQISVGKVRTDRVILYFHGGGYIAGSPDTHVGLMGRLSKLTGLRIISPAYRLAPEHPAPAAFEDAVTAHEALLDQGYDPDHIVLGGDSAGGGLALALLGRLCAQGRRPAGLFAFSPWTDLGLTGDSLRRNANVDPIFPAGRISDLVGYVAGNLDPRDPRLSPLYADYSKPPPVLMLVGTTEILLDDSRRMAARLTEAGGTVSLSEYPGAPHVWPLLDGYIPQARAALREVAGFITAAFSPSRATSPSDRRPDGS